MPNSYPSPPIKTNPWNTELKEMHPAWVAFHTSTWKNSGGIDGVIPNIADSSGVDATVNNFIMPKDGTDIYYGYYRTDGNQTVFISDFEADVETKIRSMFTTGMIQAWGTTPPANEWVLMDNGTIGSSSSGATSRADDDTQDLYIALWNSNSNSICPVTGGRGATAGEDFLNNKPIALPQIAGMTLGASGGSFSSFEEAGSNLIAQEHLPLFNLTADPGFMHTDAVGVDQLVSPQTFIQYYGIKGNPRNGSVDPVPVASTLINQGSDPPVTLFRHQVRNELNISFGTDTSDDGDGSSVSVGYGIKITSQEIYRPPTIFIPYYIKL